MAVTSVTLKWYGDQQLAKIHTAVYAGMIVGAEHFAAELRKALRAKQGNATLGIHSSPGEIPYRITGAYSDSIKVRRWRGKVQSTVKITIFQPKQKKKGGWLEEGTNRMAARPHWQVIFNREKNKMESKIKTVAYNRLKSKINLGGLDVRLG